MKQFVIFFSLFIFLFLPSSVLASETLDQAKKDYDFQLEKYREEYRFFDLKRSQYNNLQTFASQEELVAAARTMLLRRAEVWRTYLQALRTELLETDGLDATERSALATRLQDFQSIISAHGKTVTTLATKDELFVEAQTMNGLNKELQALSYEVLSHIVWGRLNATTSAEQALMEKVRTAVSNQIKDISIRETRLRGFGEIERSLALSSAVLSEVKAKYKNFSFSKSGEAGKEFSKIGEALAPAYEQLHRGYTLLTELSLGTEL